MTAEEQQILQALADRINNTRLVDKDADAEQFIQRMLGRNPDALYVMAQTILVQSYALEQTQKPVADIRAQLGRHDAALDAGPPPPPLAVGHGAGLAYPSGGYPIAGGEPEQGGGFLRSAMQTASGVGMSALAFEGIQSLMHGFGNVDGDATGTNDDGKSRDTSAVAQTGDQSGDADELSGTEGTDYSADGDDSMLADDVGDGDQGK